MITAMCSRNHTGLKQRGVGLIEVLVALFVLAVGVLGAAAMQTNALKFNQTASFRSQATFLAYEITDAMRANRTVALAGGYDIGLDDDAEEPDDEDAECAPVATCDLLQWRNRLSQRLPLGTGAIAHNNQVFTITIQWDEGRLGLLDDDETEDVDESSGQFVFVTEL